MSKNTTKLKLYKKEPLIDSSDKFDITTMLNDNWDKIDQHVGQIEQRVEVNENTRHEHSNKTVLDKITQGVLDKWDTVTNKANQTEVNEIINKAIFKEDGIFNIDGNVENATSNNVTVLRNINKNFQGNDITGILKITMPKTWDGAQVTLDIKGFAYESDKGWNLQAGAFKASGNVWRGETVILNGNPPFSKIRFGEDSDGKGLILLGEINTIWKQPITEIEKALIGYSLTGWDSEWSIDFITDETAIQNIVEPILQQNFNIANYGFWKQRVGEFTVTKDLENSICRLLNTSTINVPNDPNIKIGMQIVFIQLSGDSVFVPESGVSLFSKDNNRKIGSNFGAATLMKFSDTSWYLIGDLIS